MSQESSNDQSAGAKERNITRNPFGVIDVPDPNGPDVADFAANTDPVGLAADANAQSWQGDGSDSDNSGTAGKTRLFRRRNGSKAWETSKRLGIAFTCRSTGTTGSEKASSMHGGKDAPSLSGAASA